MTQDIVLHCIWCGSIKDSSQRERFVYFDRESIDNPEFLCVRCMYDDEKLNPDNPIRLQLLQHHECENERRFVKFSEMSLANQDRVYDIMKEFQE